MTTHSLYYLSVREVAKRYDVGVSTIWQWAKQGIFPSPVHIGKGSARWTSSNLEEYDEKVQGRVAA